MEEYMLPCLNKKLFGFECLGCGMQRATVLFFKGDFYQALLLYPAIYTLLPLLAFLVLDVFIKFKYSEKIKTILVVVNVAIIIMSYLYKQFI